MMRTSTRIGTVAADAFEPVILQYPQDLALHQRRHVADFIEKRVPPELCSNLPIRFASAPVNEPFSWPNNSLSSSDSGIAAQLTSRKHADARGLCR